MSRIHEALKRARQGQEPAPLVDLGGAPVSSGRNEVRSEAASWLNANLSPVSAPTPVPTPQSPISFGAGLTDLWDRCTKRTWKFDPAYSAFSGSNPSVEIAEQFRKLRSRLYEIRGSEPLQKLLVTSTIPGEGKTFVALNLALAIARQQGRRVLLVDADLRAPKLASTLGAQNGPGLSEFLCGAADETAIIQTDPEGSLFLIPAGNMLSNPTELLGSERLQWLFNRMSPHFDWVIVDAPPVLPVSDSGVLAGYCEGVMVVVRAGSTSYDAVGSALNELRTKKLLGVVLNRAEQSEIYEAYSYYAKEEALPA